MPTATKYHLAKGVVAVVSLFVLSLAFTQRTLAQQLTVTTIAPIHGTTNVPRDATLSITFSAALDTAYRFTDTDLPVKLELHPDTAFAAPDSISFSADRRTINFHNLSLQPDTRYVLLVTGARSASQAPLSLPATATFSTGPTLPNGSISGTVSYSGGASGAVVGVFNESVENAIGYAVVENNGTYTAPLLPGGNYFVLSIKDVNLDGEINPGKVDPIGGYDTDADKLPNQITLAAGGNLPGINITLGNATAQTARGLYSPTIENIAKAVQGDAQLVAINAANLSVGGQSTFWIYLFYSPSLNSNFGFAGSDAICFPFLDFGDESDTLDIPLPPDWIDSKIALDSAQANLGEEFLQNYPNAVITGSAGTFDLGFGEGANTHSAFRLGNRQTFSRAKPQRRLLRQAVAQPQQAWVINYTDEASARTAIIALDVRTGKPVFIFRLTTALSNLAVAQATASQWAPDAQLVLVASPPNARFSPVDGAAAAWVFVYYSAGKDSLRQFIFLFGALARQENVMNFPKQPIPSGWLDSEKTAPVAETLGGAAFRQTHPDAQVDAFLGYVNPSAPNRLLWSFRYTSFVPQPDSLTIYVDALTGVRVNDNPKTPNNFALRSAYPNPLRRGQNAEWSFYALTAVEARVSVYNVLGQRVAQILSGNLPAGESVLQWDGRLANGLPAASGAYFLRLEYRVANGKWQMMTQRVLLRN